MRNVRFDSGGSTPVFKYTNDLGDEESIEYKPPIDQLDKSIHIEDYCVELLINPLLSNESNVYMLIDPTNTAVQKVGVIFPVAVLSSDEQPEHKIHNYIFAAFHVLLERLQKVEKADFAEHFEDNVCVFVIDKKKAGVDNPLPLCIHSLRKYGYSYFEGKNSVKAPIGYLAEEYMPAGKKNIKIEFNEPALYSDPMVDTLMRTLPSAHDVTHRFVLLYQVIELLMEKAAVAEIQRYVVSFSIQVIPSNDFVDGVKNMSSEKSKIREIFSNANITTADCSEFRAACMHLYSLVRYVNPKMTSSDDMLLYSFRNKMTHDFRSLRGEMAELAITIQRFEILILKIIEKYVC